MQSTSTNDLKSGKGNSDTVQIPGNAMALSHELSSEIATALFSTKERSPGELKDLKEVIFKIHSTLEQLTRDAHIAQEARERHPTKNLQSGPG